MRRDVIEFPLALPYEQLLMQQEGYFPVENLNLLPRRIVPVGCSMTAI